MPRPLRRLLHRAVDHFADSRHAAGKASRGRLRATRRAAALQAVRQAGTTGVLRFVAAIDGDVRKQSRRGLGQSLQARNRDIPVGMPLGRDACPFLAGPSLLGCSSRKTKHPRKLGPTKQRALGCFAIGSVGSRPCGAPTLRRGTGPSTARNAARNTAGSRFPCRPACARSGRDCPARVRLRPPPCPDR